MRTTTLISFIRTHRLLAGIGALILAIAIGTAAFLLTSGGPGGLHGTYTDSETTGDGISRPGHNQSCAVWEAGWLSGGGSNWTVSVKVDGIPAGTTAIHWQGRPSYDGLAWNCTGTWTASVPAAHISYQLHVSGLSGWLTEPVSKAGQSIALTNSGGLSLPGFP